MERSILVVDPERDMAVTYERLLRRRGFRVVSAGSCDSGLLALATEPVHLVITELELPAGDGLDIVRAARRLHAFRPVLVATALTSDASRRAALAAGATAFVAKPFALETFNRFVDEALGGGRESRGT